MFSTGRSSRSLGGPRSNTSVSSEYTAPTSSYYPSSNPTATSPNTSSTVDSGHYSGAPRSTSPPGSSYTLRDNSNVSQGGGAVGSVEQRLRIVKRNRGKIDESGGRPVPAVEPPSPQFPTFDTRHTLMSSEDKVLVEALLGDVVNCMLFPDAPPPSTTAPPPQPPKAA